MLFLTETTTDFVNADSVHNRSLNALFHLLMISILFGAHS